MCDRDLRNFAHLKKDLVLKQKRLYDLLPLPSAPLFVSCFKEEKNTEVKQPEFRVVEEALDEAYEQENLSDEDVQAGDLIEIVLKKSLQKQNVGTEVREKNENNTKFQCECGLILSNKFSLKRHVDRVSFFYYDYT